MRREGFPAPLRPLLPPVEDCSRSTAESDQSPHSEARPEKQAKEGQGAVFPRVAEGSLSFQSGKEKT